MENYVVSEILEPSLRFQNFTERWILDITGNHIELISGIAFKGEDISEDSTGAPILRGINITEGYIRHSKDIDRFYTKDAGALEKYHLRKGDLVIGMDGSKVGRNYALITEADENSLLIQRVARLRAKPGSHLEYIYHNVNSIRFHKYVDEVNTSSGIPHISAKQIQNFQIHFPSLPEQQKIASFLSAVDEKIRLLKRKKELLEQYKKGVMQQLFSGKLRFKQEDGSEFPEWEEKRLGDICEFYRGGSLSKGNLTHDGDFPCIHYGELFTKYAEVILSVYSKTSIKNGFLSEIGDVLMPSSDVTPQGLAKASSLQLHGVVLGGDMNIIRPIQANSIFLSYLLNFSSNKIMKIVSGTTVKHIYNKHVKELNLCMPTGQAEQQKIACFLSSIDEKIEGISKQVKKAQEFKKGLLQQMFV